MTPDAPALTVPRALRITEADLRGIGFFVGIFPLLLAAVGLLLFFGQFLNLPKPEIFVRQGKGTQPCNHELREPSFQRGDPRFHHLVLVSNCELFMTDIPQGSWYFFWGKRVAFILQPKSSPAVHPD